MNQSQIAPAALNQPKGRQHSHSTLKSRVPWTEVNAPWTSSACLIQSMTLNLCVPRNAVRDITLTSMYEPSPANRPKKPCPRSSVRVPVTWKLKSDLTYDIRTRTSYLGLIIQQVTFLDNSIYYLRVVRRQYPLCAQAQSV